MSAHRKLFRRVAILGAASILLVLGACGGGGGGGSGSGGSNGGSGSSPPPSPPAPPTPTVSITASKTSASFGETISLQLTASSNAFPCTLTSTEPGFEPYVTPNTTLLWRIYAATTFTYTCTGTPSITPIAQSLTITMNTPAVAFKVSYNDIKDVAWNAQLGLMYIVLGSRSRLAPNSVLAFDPATGNVAATVYAGSEPRTISLSGDGAKLYVGYADTTVVSRFSLPALTRDADLPIALASSPPYAGLPGFAIEVTAAPGIADQFAVSVVYPQDILPHRSDRFLTYRDGTPLQGAVGGGSAQSLGSMFAWSGPNTLFAMREVPFNPKLARYDTTTSPIVKTGEISFSNTALGRIEFAGGLIYTNCGHVIDATSLQQLERFSRTCSNVVPTKGAQVLPDIPNDQVFFVEREEDRPDQFVYRLDVYAPDTRRLLRTARIPINSQTQLFGDIKRMMRFGTDGLAMVTEDGQLVLIQGPLIAPGGSSLVVNALPDEPPLPSHWWARVPFSTLLPKALDIVWDRHGSKLYALIPDDAVEHPGEVAVFDSLNLDHPTFITRSTPITAMDVSDDGQYLYLGVADRIERLLLPSLALDAVIPGLNSVPDIKVAPGAPRTLVTNGFVYDDTIYRDFRNGAFAVWGPTANRLYLLDMNHTGFVLDSFDTSHGGMQPLWFYSKIFSAVHPAPFYTRAVRMGDLLVSDTGITFDPDRGIVTGIFAHGTASRLGQMPGIFSESVATPAWGPAAIDEAKHRAYFLSCIGVMNDNACTTYFLAYDTRTYTLVNNWVIDDMGGRAKKLIRFKEKDFAAITYDGRVIHIPEPEATTP
jgi:hypothetical protein